MSILSACAFAIALTSVQCAAFSVDGRAANPRSPTAALYATAEEEGGKGRRAFLSALGVAAASAALSPATATAIDDVGGAKVGGRIVYGSDSIMSNKAHGTSEFPVQDDLRYGVSQKVADRICSYNRHFAENGGYFTSTEFEKTVRSADGPLTFYDSVTGQPLFVAPVGRSAEDFIGESQVHGWPSFRDEEVVWDNVRVLRSSGETVSSSGTHLGHNLPDRKGNRYCINLVSVAGSPASKA